VGPILKGKDEEEVSKKWKYKQKKKEASYNKQKGAGDKANTQTIYTAPKSTMFLGCIKPQHPHGVGRVEKDYTKSTCITASLSGVTIKTKHWKDNYFSDRISNTALLFPDSLLQYYACCI